MIRINLLAVKRAKKRDAGERALIFMGMAVLAGVAAMAFAYIDAQGELDGIKRANNGVRSDIERLKTELGDYDKIKSQRTDLLKQQKTIQALQAGRTGPLYLMRELSEILTPNKGPTFDRATYEERLRRDPNIGFNASWDTRRVWLESFEEALGKLRMKGAAKSNEDVAEFLKRLQVSLFFSDVTPESTSQVAESPTNPGAKHVTFNLSAKVVY